MGPPATVTRPMRRPGMSTQYKRCSCGCQNGDSLKPSGSVVTACQEGLNKVGEFMHLILPQPRSHTAPGPRTYPDQTRATRVKGVECSPISSHMTHFAFRVSRFAFRVSHFAFRISPAHKKTRSAEALRVNGRGWRIGIFKISAVAFCSVV